MTHLYSSFFKDSFSKLFTKKLPELASKFRDVTVFTDFANVRYSRPLQRHEGIWEYQIYYAIHS
jgi:hypothetical protein